MIITEFKFQVNFDNFRKYDPRVFSDNLALQIAEFERKDVDDFLVLISGDDNGKFTQIFTSRKEALVFLSEWSLAITGTSEDLDEIKGFQNFLTALTREWEEI